VARTAVDQWRELGHPLGETRALLVLAELEPTAETVALATAAADHAATRGARELAARAEALLGDLRRRQVPEVSVACLGGLRVARQGDPVPAGAWQSRKARELLKLLVAKRGRPAHREQILEVLWPDEDPSRTMNRLSVALSTLRSVLDPDHNHGPDHYLRADGDTVALDLSRLDVDIERFLADAAGGLKLARERAPTAKARLERAELAYTGDLFEDDPYPDWAVDLREEARLAYLEVVRKLAELAQTSHDGAARSRYLLRLIERDPFDEQAHLDLVRLLAGSGRHGEARRRYRLYCRRMEEIEVEAAPYPAGRV
jgi:DNA-binding SARP family transcriptional activator